MKLRSKMLWIIESKKKLPAPACRQGKRKAHGGWTVKDSSGAGVAALLRAARDPYPDLGLDSGGAELAQHPSYPWPDRRYKTAKVLSFP